MSAVGFTLKKINTEQFATVEKDIDNNEELEVQLSVGVSFGIDKKNKELGCYLKIQYEFETFTIIILKLSCEFEVDANSWEAFTGDKKRSIKFPAGFLQHLAVITIGTARGVLHSKTESTPYNKFYLPTVNVREIVTKDETFSLEKKKTVD